MGLFEGGSRSFDLTTFTSLMDSTTGSCSLLSRTFSNRVFTLVTTALTEGTGSSFCSGQESIATTWSEVVSLLALLNGRSADKILDPTSEISLLTLASFERLKLTLAAMSVCSNYEMFFSSVADAFSISEISCGTVCSMGKLFSQLRSCMRA